MNAYLSPTSDESHSRDSGSAACRQTRGSSSKGHSRASDTTYSGPGVHGYNESHGQAFNARVAAPGADPATDARLTGTPDTHEQCADAYEQSVRDGIEFERLDSGADSNADESAAADAR